MRLLVIEDEEKIAKAIKRGLEQESFAVDTANNGESGLDLALGEEFDLIILDVMLPGNTDGFEICRLIRKENSSVPVLMLTAKDTIPDRVRGLDIGADDYLIKPFAFDELVARVRALLRRPVESKSNVLSYADLTIDLTTKKVERASKAIDLSAKEFSLLEYLIRNPERILTKENIINHVWSFDSDILPNTVEVYIGYLRSKIDKPFPKSALINTKRGFGYKFGN